MASACNEAIIEALEKLAQIPSIISENSKSFVVESCGIQTTITASSSFEAALKFGYFLRSLNLLSSSSTTVLVNIRETTTENVLIYRYLNTTSKLLVELFKFNMTQVPQEERFEEDLCCFTHETEGVPAAENIEREDNDVVYKALKDYFGFTSFRPLQKETITAILNGRSVLTVVGTGGGKSLMYMLPAILSSKPTLVLSPIKSLIDDLLLRCSELNIKACKFTGEITNEQKDSQINQLLSYKLVFCIPEVLNEGSLIEIIRKEQDGVRVFERIVLDEAHTIVTWGESFRPAYKEVCTELGRLQSYPKLLLSATIPLKVQTTLTDIFGDFEIKKSSLFRGNLTLEVVERPSKTYDEMAGFISERKGQCGIVYCVLAHDVCKVHEELLKRNVSVAKYHGQLSDQIKASSHSKWMAGEVDVIVANSSFGMGIDKQNVRFVIHAKLPTNVEEYFQQCGRGGRDGHPAICRIYYSYSDKFMLYKLFDKQPDVFEAQCEALNDLINILENPVQCRHKEVMAYFGEIYSNFSCHTVCDNCKALGQFHVADSTADAVKVVQAVVELTGRHITVNTLKLFLLGSRQKALLADGLDSLSNFGVLNGQFVPTSLLDTFLHLLIFKGVLAEKIEKKGRGFSVYVVLGPKAHGILALNYTVPKYTKAN